MKSSSKPIRFSQHAMEQLAYRGATEEEISETIRTSKWESAELGRLECRKDFIYNQNWNNKYYKTKQIKPIFVEEEKEIVVMTVYVYYF